MADKLTEILQALESQLGDIRKANGYLTDIGLKIYLHQAQRSSGKRPSIALGARTGRLDRSGETSNGSRISSKARRADLTIEAAAVASAETEELVAHQMLEDIERAMARKTCGAPLGTINITLETWQVLDRPEGIDAAVLQILGFADYVRS